MSTQDNTVSVFIPLIIKKRNGKPRLMTNGNQPINPERQQKPHILRAIGRAWSWRRKLESGQFSTIHEIAKAEGVTDRYISRMMRLAYLSPEILERLVIKKEVLDISIRNIIDSNIEWKNINCLFETPTRK